MREISGITDTLCRCMLFNMIQKNEQLMWTPVLETSLSPKEKKKKKIEQRKANLTAIKDRIRKGETYGDQKVSRRIPKEITATIMERDRGRDFGRPNHVCKWPGPPHHIVHFEQFLNGKVAGSPHTEENLESPCPDCHKLAHEMGITSGTSIEDFFRRRFEK